MRRSSVSSCVEICVGLAAAALIPGSAAALTPGYMVDADGKVVLSASGHCVRTGQWTPELAIEQCDPELARRAALRPQAGAARSMPPGAAGAPLPELVSFTVEALFDFDQSALKPEGKAILDRLAQTLGTTDYNVIVATGHADRIGSEQYNEELSRRRSEAVKAYLVSKGVPPDRVEARGVGELMPETRPGDCTGPRSQLIPCLQPDRRVDIEASGQQSAASPSR